VVDVDELDEELVEAVVVAVVDAVVADTGKGTAFAVCPSF
jgi:hypothetical protein